MKNQHLIPLILFFVIVLGCQPSQTILNDRQPTPEPVGESNPIVPVDDFEKRLKSVRTGDFAYLYAFRLKNGAIFGSDDKRFLKENTPEANQRQLTGDEKAVIVGTNYLIPPKNLDELKKRFKIEDYSPKKDEPKQNADTNR